MLTMSHLKVDTHKGRPRKNAKGTFFFWDTQYNEGYIEWVQSIRPHPKKTI